MSCWLRRQTALTCARPAVDSTVFIHSFILLRLEGASGDVHWSTDVLNRKEFAKISVGDGTRVGVSERRVTVAREALHPPKSCTYSAWSIASIDDVLNLWRQHDQATQIINILSQRTTRKNATNTTYLVNASTRNFRAEKVEFLLIIIRIVINWSFPCIQWWLRY